VSSVVKNSTLISIVQLGTIDYATGLQLQQRLVALRKEEKIGDVLLLLEHSPVITLGRNAKAANVVASPELLAHRGVELFECDRGGDVTFHGPGQIVGYPIFDLRAHATPDGKRKRLGVIEFVRRLEEVLIRTCADFGIATKRVPGLTGVWTDPPTLRLQGDFNSLSSRAEEIDSKNRSLESRDLVFAGTTAAHVETAASAVRQSEAKRPGTDPESKLAAIGVHISRFVTSHGFALNVNTDLSYFNLIVPCGIATKPVTSMQQELGRLLDMNAVAESISRNFGTVFSSQMLWVETLDALLRGAVGVRT
jgi:lipoyl(octanoyl) transferase